MSKKREKIGPGRILTNYLGSKRIKPTQGCNCYHLAQRMDVAGADKVNEEIEKWTDEMMESIKQWRQHTIGANWKIFVRPPRTVVRNLILWACKESKGERIDG